MTASVDGSRRALPCPRRERWQPLRGGLLNLYRYDREEFRFEDGHLLLRGNNGTGKSRVLALQLPFLLDGEVSPYRMEPDRDPAKRAEWNLLMGKYPDRLGYTWLEFGRLDPDDGERYLTLGCGLQAVQGRGLVGKWFFLTEERMGEGLALESFAGNPFARKRLVEELGDRGEVFTTASEYRGAVDRRLFHLGVERYGALIELLIQLRQPQLSRKLEEKRLSAALSEALAPLSATLLDDVAEAFRELEDDRKEVEDLEAAQGGVEDFLKVYRRYTQIAARRRGEGVRRTHSAYEATQRRLRLAETALEEGEEELRERRRELERLGLEKREAQSAVETLEASPEMRDKKALDDARRDAAGRRADAGQAAKELGRARHRRQERESQEATAKAAADGAWRAAEEALGRARKAAGDVGLGGEHEATITSLGLPEDRGRELVDGVRERLDNAARKKRRGTRHLIKLEAEADRLEAELARAKERHAEGTGELDGALESQGRAQDALGAATETLKAAYRTWHEALEELVPPSAGELAEELESWSRTAAGPSPVEEATRRASAKAFEALAAEQAELEGRRDTVRKLLQDLEARAEALRRGVHEPPPLAHTRSAEGRESRPGAPLWLLCDFLPHVGEGERAGLEAALEAAGLLDAWLTPDGRLVDLAASKTDHDALLLPADAEPSGDAPPSPAATLRDVLRPAAERPDPRAAAVDDGVISAVLSRIGYGREAGEVWVDGSGRFRLGPLRGAWSKDLASHVGESAREAERRRRLAELEAEIVVAEDDLEAAVAALEHHAGRRRRARQEAEVAPSSDAVRKAQLAIDAATEEVRRRRRRLTELEKAVADARRAFNEATDERDTTAADLGLADWLASLQVLDDALGLYFEKLAALWPTLGAHFAARAEREAAADRRSEAVTDEARAEEQRLKAEERARQAEAKRDTLKESLGAGVDEILRRLEAARQALLAIEGAREKAAERQQELEIQCAVEKTKIEHENTQLDRDTAERDVAVAALRVYAAARLLRVALPGLEVGDPGDWSVTRAVEVARQVETALGGVDSGEAAWERNQGDVTRQFQALVDHLLPHGYQPFSRLEGDLFLVLVPYQGRDCTLAELQARLLEELAERRSILTAREREVIENHLIGEVATHLHDRLHAAEEWVRRINRQLDSRPTSSGVKLRFAWHVVEDGPPNLAAARNRLLGTFVTWSPDEREDLGRFLQAQIQTERDRGDGTWREQLATALDYRAWHRFSIERYQDGQWKRLTKRTYGTGSGGEKAIALTLPQFAAAAAHYESADPRAPRLILLDEAFVGVDATMRAHCMGLLESFDLDFVMTSEREWGCYATLPGLAIYQLSTRSGIDAVGVTRWVWNGRERRLVPHGVAEGEPGNAGDEPS